MAAPASFLVPASTLHDAAKALLATSENAAARIIDFMAFLSLLKDRLLDSPGPAPKLRRHHGGFKTTANRRRNFCTVIKSYDAK
jgi:hypothetical protein